MSQALARVGSSAIVQFDDDQLALVSRTLMRPKNRQASPDEIALFAAQCERTGLDPFSKQIYAIYRWDGRAQAEVMQIQAAIDGLRLTAERSKKYIGQVGPFWCGPDEVWKDVWLSDTPPLAAKVGVLKKGCKEPFWGVAKFSEYVQTYTKDGRELPAGLWEKMPANQIAKCAEALGLRKAFPNDMSGIYTPEEMGQADFDEYPSVLETVTVEQPNMRLVRSRPGSEPAMAGNEEPEPQTANAGNGGPDEPLKPELVGSPEPSDMEPEPKSKMSPAQHRYVEKLLGSDAGNDRDAKHKRAGEILGRQVTTLERISKQEASKIIDFLQPKTS